MYASLENDELAYDQEDVTYLQNRRDLAYAVQHETQEAVVKLIRYAVEKSKCKKVVISGGYGLNCVANYHYLDALKDEGIEIYVEPISNDAGTAMGAALWQHYKTSKDTRVNKRANDVFLGPKYDYSEQDIYSTVEKYDAEIKDATHEDVVELMKSKNIVANFQGRSENGPRVDGTCRIQTVSREQNPHYYDIIKTFKEKTGIPIIFNTSFNLGGEPLVETIDDAIRTLATSDIEYLYLPEFGKLIIVNN